MAAPPVWNTYTIRPLGFAGALVAATWVVPDPADTLTACAVLVGTGTPTGIADPLFQRLDLSLNTLQNGFDYFDGLAQGASLTFTFFAQTTALGWVTGPNLTASLADDLLTPVFPYLKPWVVSNLQTSQAVMQPLGAGKAVQIRGSFPRDTHARPSVSVQASSTPLNDQVIGDLRQLLGSFNAGPQFLDLGRQWNMQFSIVLWCDTPEIRDTLMPWLGTALQRLVELAPFQGLQNAVYSLEENEDFSLGVSETPLFIASASLSGLAWSSLKVPVRNWIGTITV